MFLRNWPVVCVFSYPHTHGCFPFFFEGFIITLLTRKLAIKSVTPMYVSTTLSQAFPRSSYIIHHITYGSKKTKKTIKELLYYWQETSLHEIAVPDVSLCMQDHMSVFCWLLWRWESVHISPKEETAILQGRWLDEKWPLFTLINGSCRRRRKKETEPRYVWTLRPLQWRPCSCNSQCLLKFTVARGRGIRGLDVWSSYLLHFGLLELLESELDLVCFHLRLDLLLNGKQYVIVMNWRISAHLPSVIV